MKYLGKEPIVFGFEGSKPQRMPSTSVVVSGGPANVIPEKYRCIGGRHDTRLTSCWCEVFADPVNQH